MAGLKKPMGIFCRIRVVMPWPVAPTIACWAYVVWTIGSSSYPLARRSSTYREKF
ncbi:hypothetical protein P153DRAFT_367705 [Dothidotthia symphoricarpi CBS 119687]|uniref:Uncharacterized protein n=1 Tax=Dothidotthia symphoricarpi CBS 119687 TaxID=1392245 RepID=A0A6A6A9U8_9PLEO|nr:uncharacterized protein P153DRAFT_367705 [Dothidotthia symphoricarpi CBS 119687]KAF2128590.1 hypothetical protein P153DRAFT_367705 [Dothidotthia symphoricarpi CBS 119687]